MAEVSASVEIERSPDEVWKVLSDVGGLAGWMPGLDGSSASDDGRRRTVETSGMGTLVEEILRNDDEARTLEYTIAEAPFELEHYLARWTVEPAGEGARATWHVEVRPDSMAEALQPVVESSVAALKTHLESR